MIRSTTGWRSIFIVAITVTLFAAACGSEQDDSGRSFAPEAQGGTALPSNTPAPTPTSADVDRQPNESGNGSGGSAKLFEETGSIQAIAAGLTSVSVVMTDPGSTTSFDVARSASTLASASPDGKFLVALERTDNGVTLRLFDSTGKAVAEWTVNDSATPEASPVGGSATLQTGDRISWSPDSSRIAISISGHGLFVSDIELKPTQVGLAPEIPVTALAWSPSGQSIAAAVWRGDVQAAQIRTVSLQSIEAEPSAVLSISDEDGRFIRSLAWGSEQVGLVFTLRSVGLDFTKPNDLYYLPRFGEPMRLLASAGVAAQTGVIDQIAIAANGTTVAFTVLVPGNVGLRFHSVWVTDATAPDPTKADTTGIRRISELAWTPTGLAIVGTRRTLEGGAAYQATVVEIVTASDAPKQISVDRSPATPVGSPAASPVAGTPETSTPPRSFFRGVHNLAVEHPE